MESFDARTRALLGDSAVARLRASRAAVVGLGGVGGASLLALARVGVGTLVAIDGDIVQPSNLNRQMLAFCSTIGQYKAEAAKVQIADICPETIVSAHSVRLTADNIDELLDGCEVIIDAVDDMSAKLAIAEYGYTKGIPVIASMGTGNKLDPSRFRLGDVFETRIDPLARVMRRELKKRGIDRLQVVWSDEEPITPKYDAEGRRTPASVSFVPPAAGLLLAKAAVDVLLKEENS